MHFCHGSLAEYESMGYTLGVASESVNEWYMIMKSSHQITDLSHLLTNYMCHRILKLFMSGLADRHLK